jgi:DNA-binding NarL/FixJ family response regulator
MITILIVEDQKMMRESLEHIIGRQNDMEVAAVTDDASKVLQICHDVKPDLVLMDVVTGKTNGINVAAKIIKELPKIKIIIMTGYPEITFMNEARKAGVHSFIYKSSGFEDLFFLIRRTMEGTGYYPGPVNTDLLSAQLTEKEIDVVRLAYKGKSRSEMIKELGLSEKPLKQL